MLNSVEITDNSSSILRYINKLDSFRNGTVYNFNPGLNFIIGPNGSGKSTLIKIISKFLLCDDTISSRLPDLNKLAFRLTDFYGFDDSDNILDGIKVKHDYLGITFRYRHSNELKGDSTISNKENFALYCNSVSHSTGESSIIALESLLDQIRKQKSYKFPLDELLELSNNSNDLWKRRILNLIKYYKDNQVSVDPDNYRYTLLIDEPDRNLDVDNINDLFSMLSYDNPSFQLICVIHNPILIYKLSKKKKVNFIELENGYLDKVINLISN